MINQRIIDFNGISIAVKSCGSGKGVILLIHGSSMSSDNWMPQLESEELCNDYRLVAVDLPGHGQSERFENDVTAYRPKRLASLVKEIFEKYDGDRYILVGLSLGTNIIGEINLPWERCAGIVLASPCIVNPRLSLSTILTPGPNGHVMVATNPSNDELQEFVFQHVKKKELAARYIESFRNTDPAFREELGKATLEFDFSDQLKNIENWKVPVCVVFGKDETLIKTDYLNDYPPLWNKKIYLVENAGHMVNEEQPETFNKILLSFAQEVFK